VSPDVLCWADDLEFEQLADRTRAPRLDAYAEGRAAADRALDLYRGAYLPKVDADWCATRRRHLQTRYLRVLRDLIETVQAAGQHEAVIAYAERFLRTDPDDEAMNEALMRSQAELGNRPAAIRHYQRYAQHLHDELQAQPSRRLRLLSEQIAHGS
jgi:DNA-binding SARP family transcriptional activator